MIKIIFLTIIAISYAKSNITAGLNIYYDMNTTNIKEASVHISKSIKNGSMVSKYEIAIKNIKDEFILDIANLSFKTSFGKFIIGKKENPNKTIYELMNRFETLKTNTRFDGITYIMPSIYDNVSEFDYAKNVRVFRSIWVKNKLKTSFFYLVENEKEIIGVGFHKNTKILDLGYTYENIVNVKTTHSAGLVYKLGNYHYKSIYVFNSLNESIFITGLDIFLLRDVEKEAKIYFESFYGDSVEKVEIGGRFYF